MNDIYSNFHLQREDVLARIAESLQLDKTRKERMESAYTSICTLISEDTGFFKGMDIDLYPHGSVRIGATVKPFKNDEFDLDMVLHINKPYYSFTPQQVYDELYKKLKDDGRYSHMVEKKRRCIRLNYAGDFHIDITIGCIINSSDPNNLKVPDRELRNWVDSNPKGYADWFLKIANSVREPLLEGYYDKLYSVRAEIQELPTDEFYKKKPLQRAVQLIKRYRDIYFANNSDYATSSIILTTLAAHFYNGEPAIFDTIDNILSRIVSDSGRLSSGQRIKITNPVNPNEDFTDKWDTEPLLYKHFLEFSKDLYTKWQQMKKQFSESAPTYEFVFGENIYKGAIKEQVEKLGKISSDKLYNAGALIMSGQAKTDNKGNINPNTGTKNERHRDFGDK